MKPKAACIIGNGPSRKPIDLFDIPITTFGCNALYRDFGVLDYLIAIDDGMIAEIQRQELPHTKVIIPPEEDRWESKEYNPYTRRRSNAGMNAMSEAIALGHNMLYCLGFDFILSGDASVDNIYKNTSNYGPETHAHENDNYWRIAYFEWFAKQNPSVNFFMVIPDDAVTKQVNADNVLGMRMNKFLSKLSSETAAA
jgi:hypothetical protein